MGQFNGMFSQSHLPHCRVLPPGEFNGMSSQSHVSHCRVLPPGEFNDIPSQSHVSLCRVGLLPLGEFSVMIPVTCHIAGCKNSIRHIENRFSTYFIFCFLNAVWALASGGFRIVSDTLVYKKFDSYRRCRTKKQGSFILFRDVSRP